MVSETNALPKDSWKRPGQYPLNSQPVVVHICMRHTKEGIQLHVSLHIAGAVTNSCKVFM